MDKWDNPGDPPKNWTKEQDALLRKLREEGLSYGAIAIGYANYLDGRSRNALIGRAKRLGITSVMPAKKKIPHTPNHPKRKPTPPAPVTEKHDEEVPEMLPIAVAVREVVNRVTGNPVLAMNDQHCRWPNGEPRHPGFHFCMDDVQEGSVYCAAHHKIGYTGVPKRDRRKAPELVSWGKKNPKNPEALKVMRAAAERRGAA